MTVSWMPWLAAVFLGSGCGSSVSRLEDCEKVSDETERNECFARFLPERFRSEADAAAEMVESQITDPQIRDFVYLTVTRTIDPGSYRWCDRIQEPAIKDRCRVLVSRPHLHRELVGAPAPSRGREAPAAQGLPGSPGSPARPQGTPIPTP